MSLTQLLGSVGRTISVALVMAWLMPATALAEEGALFVHAAEDAVTLRWNAPLQQGYRGFYVERKPANATDWQRITPKPITRIADVTEIRTLLGYNADAFLTFFDPKLTTISDKEFNLVASDDIARSLIQLISVKEPAIGNVLGEIYADEQLQPGESFNYRVIRIAPSGGEAVWATSASTVTHGSADEVPIPKGIKGIGQDSGALLGWDHDAQLSRSGRLTGYRAYRAEKPFGPFNLTSVEPIVPAAINGQLPEYFLTERYLSNGQSYWYYISGVNILGFESKPSEIIEVKPRDMEPPPPPTGLKGRLLSTHGLIEWEAVKVKDLAGYRVYRASNTQGPYELVAPVDQESSQSSTNYLDTQVEEDDIFWYQITAVDTSDNESRPSEIIEVFRPDITPPAAPQEVVAASDETGLHISWAANTEKDLAGYLVKRTTRITGRGEDAEVAGPFFTQNVKPLEETRYTDAAPEQSESRYAFHIIAVDKAGNQSKPSEFVIARMPDIVPPSRPAVTSIVMQEDQISINWGANTEEDLLGYRIYRSEEGSGNFTPLNEELIAPDSTNFLDLPPELGQVYEYQMTAIDETNNESEPSFALPIKYIDVKPPDPPTQLAIKVEQTGLLLSWTPSTSGDVSYIYLYRSKSKAAKPRVLREVAVDATQVLDFYVEKNETYTYFMRAFDKVGNMGIASESVTAKFDPEDEEKED